MNKEQRKEFDAFAGGVAQEVDRFRRLRTAAPVQLNLADVVGETAQCVEEALKGADPGEITDHATRAAAALYMLTLAYQQAEGGAP